MTKQSSLCKSLAKEEDATVWARYSSAQFDQGAGRHACNNPYNATLEVDIWDKAMKAGHTSISHKDFLDLIAPSFAGIEDREDMSAILARTHVILLTEKAVYWRLAGTGTENIDFLEWPADHAKDLLADDQKPIFKAYKQNPDAHDLPDNFHEDSVWSQELLRKLLCGEHVPRSINIRGRSLFSDEVTHQRQVPRLLPDADMNIKIKKEKIDNIFKNLKRQPNPGVIDLGSPSPMKQPRSVNTLASSSSAPPNPDFPGFPAVGEAPDEGMCLEDNLEEELDKMLDE